MPKSRKRANNFWCICLCILSLIHPYTIRAEETEEPQSEITDSVYSKEKEYNFKAKQLILPLALCAVGATGLIENSPLNKLSNNIHDEIAKKGYHTEVDNWIQYAPIALHLGLGAAGVKCKHTLWERTQVAATAYACMAIVNNGIKYTVREGRPDSSAHNSFPSGHTATAFTGAELVRIEYGPWYGALAYATATAVGVMRVINDRHWSHDVIAGAGLGILSARVGLWMLPVWRKVLKSKKDTPAMSIVPAIDPWSKHYALSTSIQL